MAANGFTGDVKNNLSKLLREIQRMKLPVEPNIQGLSLGIPSDFLPIIHCALMHYSAPLANWLATHDYELYARNDLRFVEGMYKVMRDVFYYQPRLSLNQFLDVGYAERKIIMTTDILRYCQAKHHELSGRSSCTTSKKLKSSVVSGLIEATELPVSSKACMLVGSPTIVNVCSEPNPSTFECRNAAPMQLSPTPDPHFFPPNTSESHCLGKHKSLSRSTVATSTEGPSWPLQTHPLPYSNTGEAAGGGFHGQHRVPTSVQGPKVEGLVVRHKDERATKHERNPPQSSKCSPQKKQIDVNIEQSADQFDTESVVSWHSLPLHEVRDREHDRNCNRGVEDQHPSSAEPNSSSEVCAKIEALTQTIEKLSARFVILETQLKHMESQRSTGGSEKGSHDSQGEVQRSATEGASRQPLSPVHMAMSNPPQPRNILKTSVNTEHNPKALVDTGLLTTSTALQADVGQKLCADSTVEQEQKENTVPELGLHRTPTHSQWSLLKPSLVSSAGLQSPATPEETRKLIDGLRQRAMKTKEFLNKATS